MKKIAILFILLFSVSISAQIQKTIALNWSSKRTYSQGLTEFIIPSVINEGFRYDVPSRSVRYSFKIFDVANIQQSDVQLQGLTYSPVTTQELGQLDISKILDNHDLKVYAYKNREQPIAEVSIAPIIKVAGGFQKLTGFTYQVVTSAKSNPNILNTVPTVSQSVLATGTFKRFYVEKSGVYKLSKSFLNSIGITTNGIDPRKLKVYGNGGRMVPLSNQENYPFDLEENAIQVVGEDDGVFNDSDYILMYCEGMDNWSDENETHLNLYADKSFYYVTVAADAGKRIQSMTQPSGAPTQTFTTFDDYQFHEVDLTNIGKLGRLWFGESFATTTSQEFTFAFPNAVNTATSRITVHVGANSFADSNFKVSVNGQTTGTVLLSAVIPNAGTEASHSYLNSNIPTSQNYTVKLEYDNQGVPTAKAFLDYIIIKTKSNLTGTGKQYRFYDANAAFTNGIGEYQITNAAGIQQVWDITDIYNVSGIVNTAASLNFKVNLGTERRFITVVDSDVFTPLKESDTSVANQDLKGTLLKDANGDFEDVDYVIVTPDFLKTQADQLAEFHRSYSNYTVRVVTLPMIYQEFSGGKQDIGAIRNMMRYIYYNASSPTNRVKYLNLFGDASYDFKNRIANNTNIVPIYHAVNSYYSGETSFASDDFFALMDDTEGDPIYGFAADIAVGRMLVSTPQQAAEMVNKVIEYHDEKSFGSWRNNYVSISDDADKDPDASLQVRQNELTDEIYTQKAFINYKKIFMDSYVQQTTAGGDRYPQAKLDLNNAFEKGALVFNYLGHGGEDGLTAERLWDKFDGYDYMNRYRYPLFITITCEFSRFDNPQRPTAGEYTYWNPKGGAISLITTIRSIGQFQAENFNDNLSSKLFAYGSNSYWSIAESMRQAKAMSNNNSATRVVFYLGDPALKLAIAKPKIVLTKINDVPISQPTDDLKALGVVKLSGEVQNESGVLQSNYNGELAINVFDKPYTKDVLNNDGFSTPLTFSNLGETIFRGNVSVVNGQFDVNFVVPRDIRIPIGNGRVSFYSKENNVNQDHTGYSFDIRVGGVNTAAEVDNVGPRVRLYMNDESFVDGGITNASPYFLAFLEDEHGINTASGIGHDIVAILDGDETNPYVLNDYYETQLNDYTKGKIRFPFRDLAKGFHTITFKAWDVYNNPVTAEIHFVVADGNGITLTNVLNYPNPFVNYTEFWFNHNRPLEPLEVQVQIFTVTGKIVKTINQTVTTDGFLSREIKWDGLDDFGSKIGKGVYVYKLKVRSTVNGNTAEKIEKLVIL
ncbi:type IX secretion system sortase PorU [Flavobacterium sp. N1719]|uniref:type IX secretion system sortase PorU n=1 Tax=Flavobacterium sp. N1719 TaxID=2885633 RepID=UPI0022232C38|nr:type IX secretion system sortase PorU [Flavobacterium sp. N1719]